MGLIDLLLNLVALLLWLNLLALRFEPLLRPTPASLVGTLRRAEPLRLRRWHFLVALAALLVLRAWLYWQIGSGVDWTPNLPLGAIAVSFRSDYFGCMILFSLLSFAVTIVVFYLWLLLLSLVNGHAGEADTLQTLVRLHLGRVGGWPWPIKALLPFLVAALFWLALNPLLVRWNILPAARSPVQRLEQAAVIGLGAYLSWRSLIGGLLALCLLNTYVFLGSHPFWNFVGLTGRNLLAPIRWIPLRLGKVDFAPVVGMVLVFLAAQLGEAGLTALYRAIGER